MYDITYQILAYFILKVYMEDFTASEEEMQLVTDMVLEGDSNMPHEDKMRIMGYILNMVMADARQHWYEDNENL